MNWLHILFVWPYLQYLDVAWEFLRKITLKGHRVSVLLGACKSEELPKLFTKFHRIKDEKTQDVRGTGLGLWITKRIVQALGGKISAESIYGTGTSITFTLPLIGRG